MLINYLKTACRHIGRNKMFSLIGVSGLALGMACSLLIFLWIRDEARFDRFHPKAGQIHRLAHTERRPQADVQSASSFSIMAPLLAAEYPAVKAYVRFYNQYNTLVGSGETRFYEKRFCYADANVFDVFDFPLLTGDPHSSLEEPFSVVLTEDTARKYFGVQDPIGRMLRIDDETDFRVTGVLKKLPAYSHIQFDFLASFSSLNERYRRELSVWAFAVYTYLVIPDPEAAAGLNGEFSGFVLRHKGKAWQDYHHFFLQPLTAIHLHSHLNGEWQPNGDIRYIYIFSAVALLILFIACINFTNLALARSARRSREVGIRKVVGALRGDLIRQFLSESLLFSLLALPLALALAGLAMPLFNQLTGKELTMGQAVAPFLAILTAGIILFVALAAGAYPAFILSSFRPVEALKSKFRIGRRSFFFRRVLIVIQFSISIALISGTVLIQRQLNYIKNERLGFQKENLLVLRLGDEEVKKNLGALKNELGRIPGLLQAAGSSALPSFNPGMGVFAREGAEKQEKVLCRHVMADFDFVPTLGIELREGRNLQKIFASDENEAILINETMARMLDLKDPVGKKMIDLDDRSAKTIVGVVKDFHFRSKREKIEPLVIQISPDNTYIYFLSLRVRSTSLEKTLAEVKRCWSQVSSRRPCDYFFLDDNFDALYREEERLGMIFKTFSFLTILVACLGLFGLASFSAEQRTKEIGIRKTLGASTASLAALVGGEFLRLILLANLLAWPVAYVFVSGWLRSFAYRIPVGLTSFILSGALAMLVALLTMSFQAVKAALANPADSLKYE